MMGTILEIFHATPTSFIVAGFFLLLLCASELGYRAGVRRRLRASAGENNEMRSMQGATLGLLALLLGFSFAMAATRNTDRGTRVAEEAEAVGSALLRADLLPEPARTESRALWREYALRRTGSIAMKKAAKTEAVPESLVRTRIWEIAATTTKAEPLHAPRALYADSVTRAFEASDALDAAMRRHVPAPVVLLLVLTGTVTAAALGHGCGMSGYRFSASQVSQFLIIALVFGVIVRLGGSAKGAQLEERPGLQKIIESIPGPVVETPEED